MEMMEIGIKTSQDLEQCLAQIALKNYLLDM